MECDALGRRIQEPESFTKHPPSESTASLLLPTTQPSSAPLPAVDALIAWDVGSFGSGVGPDEAWVRPSCCGTYAARRLKDLVDAALHAVSFRSRALPRCLSFPAREIG
ncbi:hypothetical protein E2562_025749 [Oryza meyeriana var. granulata]|uniref:Uncharacterized protein n=1 Tax=Oryza meyeriana var. granulata TaxID=110450 RepID=A0A6G1CSK6_9ORYZ|nr:hypothetical protein E2562_025749 [Oryza meyeriana var. granulata]